MFRSEVEIYLSKMSRRERVQEVAAKVDKGLEPMTGSCSVYLDFYENHEQGASVWKAQDATRQARDAHLHVIEL